MVRHLFGCCFNSCFKTIYQNIPTSQARYLDIGRDKFRLEVSHASRKKSPLRLSRNFNKFDLAGQKSKAHCSYIKARFLLFCSLNSKQECTTLSCLMAQGKSCFTLKGKSYAYNPCVVESDKREQSALSSGNARKVAYWYRISWAFVIKQKQTVLFCLELQICRD